jgi:hypothetical protein
MDARVASCAKEYDVSAFRDGVDSDIASLRSKTSFLDDTAKAQGKALVMVQQRNALAMFHRRYSEWKRNALESSMLHWKRVVRREIKYEKDKVSQKRLMKKILTNIMSRRKRAGFEKWIKYRNWHRNAERLKVKATALVCERLKIYLSAAKTEAFHKWRRMAVVDKMKTARTGNLVIDDKDVAADQSKLGNQQSLEMLHQKPRSPTETGEALEQNQFDLHAIIDSLKYDAYGASCALALELQNIKMHDIATLRREMTNGHKFLMSSTSVIIDEAVQKIDHAAAEFHATITQRIDNCDAQFPSIYSQLKELSNLFKSHKAQLDNIEESNGKRLDTLVDQNATLEKRLALVEVLARNTSVQVESMIDEQAKSNNSIQHLNQVIARNEARRDEESRALRDVMDRFGDELLRTKVTLGHTQVRCENLENELAKTKEELSHFQAISQAESEKVASVMNHPGIQKTNLDRIVRVGHAYENLAKEKNYVTGINVMATMTSVVALLTKSGGEKQRREEQVDVPVEIAAFAHDYAEWIAYQTDHESLLRLIAGTNPDEQVYAEDDMITRRKDLLEELKSNLSSELERVTYPGVVDVPDATTRGLGLRWEARSIFLARVLDATKAALSKCDHLSLPAQTRLGRTRPASANVTVCVACDRPMRKRSGQNQHQSVPAKQDGESNTKMNVKTGQSVIGKCIAAG